MDRLAAFFEQLPVPEVARLLRRTAYSAIAVGIVLLGVGIGVSHALAGFGACLGLGLGLGNIRLVVSSVSRVSESGAENPKRILASRTAYRLAITTVVVIGLLLLSVELGFGAAGGIALFYFLLVANLIRAILRQGAPGTGGVPA